MKTKSKKTLLSLTGAALVAFCVISVAPSYGKGGACNGPKVNEGTIYCQCTNEQKCADEHGCGGNGGAVRDIVGFVLDIIGILK